MKNLTYQDVLALFVCWAGVGATAYLIHDPFVGLIAVCAGYYLSKWIITKTNTDFFN